MERPNGSVMSDARVDKVRRETIRVLTHSILDLLYINIKQNRAVNGGFVALNRIRSFSRPRRKFLRKINSILKWGYFVYDFILTNKKAPTYSESVDQKSLPLGNNDRMSLNFVQRIYYTYYTQLVTHKVKKYINKKKTG